MKKEIPSNFGTRYIHNCAVGLSLFIILTLSSCLPSTEDTNLSKDPAQRKEPIQKLLQIELSIDAQGNVIHNEHSLGNLSNSLPISEFLLSNLNYDLSDRPKVVLNIAPSTPYSVVKKAILSCAAAKLQSVVFVGAEVTVSLPSGPLLFTPTPEFDAPIIALEIGSSGQVIADGLPKDSPLDENLPQLTSYFYQHGQVYMADPNSNISIHLLPEDSAKHKYTINVLNALSTANFNLDLVQERLPKNDRKLLDSVFIEFRYEDEEVEVKTKKAPMQEGRVYLSEPKIVIEDQIRIHSDSPALPVDDTK